jgi:hypothetical protein
MYDRENVDRSGAVSCGAGSASPSYSQPRYRKKLTIATSTTNIAPMIAQPRDRRAERWADLRRG